MIKPSRASQPVTVFISIEHRRKCASLGIKLGRSNLERTEDDRDEKDGSESESSAMDGGGEGGGEGESEDSCDEDSDSLTGTDSEEEDVEDATFKVLVNNFS